MNGEILDMLDTDTHLSAISGIQVEVKLGLSVEINQMPNIADDGVSFDHTTQDFDFVPDSGKGYFRRFQMRTQSGEIDTEMVGDVGVYGYKHKLVGFIPKGGIVQNKFINNIKNRMLILLVTENGGTVKNIGTKGIPAYLKVAKYNSGKQVGDVPGPGWNVEFHADAIDPPYIYTGTPKIEPNP